MIFSRIYGIMVVYKLFEPENLNRKYYHLNNIPEV